MATRNNIKDKQNFERTIKEARIGHRESQYEAGLMYANGVGVDQDMAQAIYWVRQSADRGFVAAQYLLATRYSIGEVVEQDDHQALKWYLKAADQGHPKAIYKLGKFYSTTHERAAGALVQAAAVAGVPQAQFDVASNIIAANAQPESAEQAFLWCEQAAEQGLASAQCALADRYVRGDGVAQDIDQAYVWYRKAARQYHVPAQVAMAQLDVSGQGRHGAKRSRGNSGSTERRRNAQRWVLAGESGDASVKYQLGVMFQNGWGVAQDQVQCRRWFEAAATLGYTPAQFELGQQLEFELNYQEAAVWYELAAKQMNHDACAALGRLLLLGLGISKDDFTGLAWTIKAAEAGQAKALAMLSQMALIEPQRIATACLFRTAESGDPEAQFAMGHYFEFANKPERNVQRALHWYRLAAEQGHVRAQCALGLVYSAYSELPKDMVKAREWFLLAADQNDPKALWNLAVMLMAGKNGVKKDLKQAFVLCKKSAVQGFVPATATLGILYAKMKKTKEAFECWRSAALAGDAESQFNLAVAFSVGRGVEKSSLQAFEWFLKAAEQGIAEAQSKVGLLYITGLGVCVDMIEALKWFFIASRQNVAAAKANAELAKKSLDIDQVLEAERRAALWKVSR